MNRGECIGCRGSVEATYFIRLVCRRGRQLDSPLVASWKGIESDAEGQGIYSNH